MSSLYQDPTELQKKLGRNKTGNIIQDGFTDWVSGGLSIGPDGKVKREGAAWWLQGLTPGAKGIAETQDAIQKNDQVRALVKDAPVDEGAILKAADGATITPDNIGGFIKKATLNYQTPAQIEAQKRADAELRLAQDRQTASDALAQQTLALQRDTQSFNQQMAAENNRNRWQDRKDQREERLLTRQLNAQTSADNLQLQYAQLESQERRDAKDRKDRAILTLLEGLRSLGTAFTI